MSSADESDTNNVALEHETQFVEQSGDEDVLWEVQEITAERGNKYKVKWAGIDPITGKPWSQSWVAKHDCTDDLVVDWKAKKRRLATGRKRGRPRKNTIQRAGSSTSGAKTRPSSTSKPTSSRLDPAERQETPLPPKPNTVKRKRRSSTPRPISSGAVQAEEQSELPRPRKKQKTKTIVEVLLPPISSSDEDEHGPLLPLIRAKDMSKNEGPKEDDVAPLDVSGDEDSSPPKTKAGSERHSDTRSKGSAVSSRASDARVETKVTVRRKEKATKADALPVETEDEDEQFRPPSKVSKPEPRKSTTEQKEGLSEKEAAPTPSVKVGPPRGVKRQEKAKKAGLPEKSGPSRTNLPKDDAGDDRVAEKDSGHGPSSFGSPTSLLQQNPVDGRTSPPHHIAMPQVSPSTFLRSPVLSPGAKARLELFDRMMANLSQSDAALAPLDVSEHVPDNVQFDFSDIQDVDNPLDLPPPSLPPMFKPDHTKASSPTRLIVPETESSGNSQSQSQLLPKPPSPPPQPPQIRNPSPRKPIELPTIAVITASAPSSSASPQDLFPPHKPPPFTDRSLKRPVSKSGPNVMNNVRSCAADLEAPPSSIESFPSPQRIDKGKRRAVEDDQLRNSSFSEGDGERQKKGAQREMTDSELKKRGKELFDQIQLAREAERQKKKKPKRLKTINEIVNGRPSSPLKKSPFLTTNGGQSTVEMRLEDVVDLSGGANSSTLNTPEQSEAKPLSEEMRERLRIELRQEEEESTQEAMGIYPPPPSEVVNYGSSQVVPPKDPLPGQQTVAVDHVEQPSTDLLQVSIIAQASQEQQYEDTDIEPLPADRPDSSPPRPVPENLTDSPKRRLGEALSLLNVKSEEIQRLESELANEHNTIQGLKAELVGLQQSTEPTGPVRVAWEAERAQWTQERTKWEDDFSTWEAQRKEMSEEKEILLARVAELSDAAVRAEEAKVKLSELEAERAAWANERNDILNDVLQRSEELTVLTKIRGEYDQDQSKWEGERTSWAEERTRWETERATLQEKQETLSRSVDELTASMESMTAAMVSVEKDRDFFREQYSQASAFVGSVRDENVELEKRVKIAEGQAQEGVATIKALFEGRVKALQADVERWRGLTELLQEKDRRTNDELRSQAAKVPELTELCARLRAENETLQADVRKFSQAQQRSVRQRNKLFYEILLLKRERVSLRSKLSKRRTKKANTKSSNQDSETCDPTPPLPIPEDPESIDPNDMELLPDPTPQSSQATFDEAVLFPCMWRPQWRDQCQQIFDTKEDLERHMQDHFRDLLVQ